MIFIETNFTRNMTEIVSLDLVHKVGSLGIISNDTLDTVCIYFEVNLIIQLVKRVLVFFFVLNIR